MGGVLEIRAVFPDGEVRIYLLKHLRCGRGSLIAREGSVVPALRQEKAKYFAPDT